MKKPISLFLALQMSVMAVPAFDYVSVKPGSMSSAIENPNDVTVLAVKGPVDASDLFFIGKNMPHLASLDLRDAVVEGYVGTRIDGSSKFAANMIPGKVFAGLPLISVALPSSEHLVIGEASFAGTALESLVIPSNVDSIATGAFAASPELKTVEFLSSTAIGDGAFAACPSLCAVVFGGQKEIGAYAFSECQALAGVGNSATVVCIGASAFDGCGSLGDFEFGKDLKIIGARAFAGTALADVDLAGASSLETIGDWAFSKNTALRSVVLNDNVREIGKAAFFDCPSLAAFNLPESCSRISDYMLKDDSSVSGEALIHGRVDSIGDYALKGHDKIEHLILPASLRYIGNGAMEGMTALRYVNAKALDSVPELGEDVWAQVNRPEVKLEVKSGMADEFGAAEQWCDFNIVMDTGNIDAVVGDSYGSGVRGRFVGKELQVYSKSVSIETIALYDVSGRMLSAVECDGQTARIDTSSVEGSLFIVECVLEGKQRAVLKLMRN